MGSGENHRNWTFDMILLKDNHVDFAGSIENAIRGAQKYLKERINHSNQIEVRNLQELETVLLQLEV